MQHVTHQRRPLLRTLAAVLLCPVMVTAGDRTPAPVAEDILRSPMPENLVTLIGALRGSGCGPKHTDVGDAIVGLGSKSVPRLVARLEGSDKWWIQLETIHLLGLIGSAAKGALPALDKFVSEKHHPLPARFSLVTVAAICEDVAFLTEMVEKRHTAPTGLAIELLGRMGPTAGSAVPALQKYIVNRPLGNSRSAAIAAIKAITTPDRP